MANKELITEADVRALARGARLVLGADAIVTPAARDLAFERGVRLVRAGDGVEGGGCGAACGGSCGGPGAAGGCTWSRMLAVDGTYVVVVKDGKARVARLTEAGPQALA